MPPEHDVTTYLLVGQLGPAFREIGLVEGARETIVRNLISGQYPNALRVVVLNPAEGSLRERLNCCHEYDGAVAELGRIER
jgi:hypothetical protein